MTKFFEPISVSATHIYHSALELCPISSIVRKLYHDRCHGISRFPRVVIGTQELWNTTISFSGKDVYHSCTWSPCGQFVAARTDEGVEIRNQLTFELLTVLSSTKTISLDLPPCPPAYSPDGKSLACGFRDAITIWDIQTGGVAKEIVCALGALSLVWSLDGSMIAATFSSPSSALAVATYDVASGAQLFAEFKWEANYRLWACEKSFRLMETALDDGDTTFKIAISKIGSTLVGVESFSVTVGVVLPSTPKFTFSPSACRVAVFGVFTFYVLDIQNSKCLLEESGRFTSSQFSSGGNLFAASHQNGIRVWKYISGSYVLWGESPFPYLSVFSRSNPSLQFSPSSSSILCWCGNLLQAWRLQDPLTAPKTSRRYAAMSRSGRRVATAYKSEKTIELIDLHSQAPSQFVEVGVEIEGLVITGNVLLVASSGKIMAWLLTEEGTVEGDHHGRGGSIWTLLSSSWRCMSWCLRVGGHIGVIKTDDPHPVIYHTETGEALEGAREPQHFSHRWVPFYQLPDRHEYRRLGYPDAPQDNIPPEEDWLILNTAMRKEGWVMDPQGRHRLWVPVEWRKYWKRENWHHDITTLFSNIGSQPVIIKF